MTSSKPPASEQDLSNLERQVMQEIWRLGPSTADDLRRALEPERVLKDSTVRTILRRLESKGFVTHQVDGRTYVYHSAIRPRRAAAQAVQRIVERFCGGSVEELLLGLVDQQVVSRPELEALARRIDADEPSTGDDQ